MAISSTSPSCVGGSRRSSAELIAGLADRPDDVHHLGRQIIEAREIQNLVMRAVQRGTDERVHARRHADVVNFALALQLRDLREQHARLCDEIATRLDPQRELRMRSLERSERRAELRQDDALLPEPLRYAEPAAEIDVAHVRESLRQAR